jgi:hypothetical protein
MNWYKYIAMMVVLSVFVAMVTAIETPRKPKKGKEKIYVLPIVGEMYENPNPLQF